MPRSSLLLVFVAAITWFNPAPARTFHVAPPPLGDDTHDGSAARPFATPARAQQAVRTHLAREAVPGEVVVELAAGLYELAAPLRFEPADSGRNGHVVVWRAAPGAVVQLSGGRSVAGWTPEDDGSWRAAVGVEADFRQLWVDGRRAVRARRPDAGRMLTLTADRQADGFDLPRELLADVTVNPDEVEMSVHIAWMHKRLRIARLAGTTAPETVRAVIAAPEWDGITRQPQGDRVYLGREYWLENAPEFLDAPGEFHLDRAAGVLRYRPRPGEDLARATVVRPELEQLIVLAGTPDAPVHDLRFEGLTFVHTGWTRPNRHGFVDVQANSLIPAKPAAPDAQYRHNQRKDRVPAALHGIAAHRIVVRNCRFARLGGTGVMFTGGGEDNVIEGNSFADLAGGGIEIGEDAARPADPRLFPRRTRIANNFLTGIGEDYHGSVAILGYYTDGSVITHNEIAGLPYTAISQGWGWGSPPAPAESRANRITHNRLANYMRRVDDGGGIYTTDRLPASEIAGNVLDRMMPPDPHTKAGGAIYLDQFTEGVHVHDNVVTGAVRWLNIWNPNIRGNRVVANFADTAALRDDGTDNIVEPAILPATDGRWPGAAEAIRARAGLEPAFAGAREFAAPADVIVESDSVHFQAVRGAWMPAALPGRYAGHCRQSVEPAAAARWAPVLPRSGRYEIRVWQPAGAAAARYHVRHAEGETTVAAPDSNDGDWRTLGRFTFAAGIGAEVLVTRADGAGSRQPLVLDAIRFTLVGGN